MVVGPVDDELSLREAPIAAVTHVAVLVPDGPHEHASFAAVVVIDVVGEAVRLAAGGVAGELDEMVPDEMRRRHVALDDPGDASELLTSTDRAGGLGTRRVLEDQHL